MFLLNLTVSIITKMKRFSNSVRDICFLAFNLNYNLIVDCADKTDLFSGCPVGLQLIGKTLEEEAVLRMTYIVDEALKKQDK
jgi:Asp-tRNA(Asn)/Glu-tRNA(Gln) amidotransferase A subunit family amidase